MLPPEENGIESPEGINSALDFDITDLITTVENLMHVFGLNETLDDFSKLNETQILSRVNYLKAALGADKEEVALVINQLEKLSRYDVDDLSKLTEKDIVAILKNVVNILGSNENVIIGKLIDVSSSLPDSNEKQTHALINTIAVLHIMLEKLSKPNEIENLVALYKNEIISSLSEFVQYFKFYRGDLLLQSIVNDMKNSINE